MNQNKSPSILISFVPVLFLMIMLIINILVFKDDATGGANQVALILSAALTLAIGILHLKIPYKKIEENIISHMWREIN